MTEDPTPTPRPEDPAQDYDLLQIDPDCSPAELHFAFEKMIAAWDPDRFPHVQSWKETSDKKQREIREAYERLRVLQEARETAGPEGPPRTDPTPTLLSVPVNPARDDEIPADEDEDPPRETAPARFVSGVPHRSWFAAAGVMIGVLLILALLWPGLYHYETVRLDGKDYPLRVNRLTSRAQYSDGRQWLDPPLPAAALPVTALPAEPLEQAAPPPPPVAPFVAAPAAEPPAVATPPVKTVTMPREKPTPGPAIETAPAADRTRAKAVPKGRYGIQVGAYPETAKAEAQANALRAKYPTARVEVIRIEGKGPWYRVLVGRFENRDDALRYLKDHRIGEAYPGSFVQTSTRP